MKKIAGIIILYLFSSFAYVAQASNAADHIGFHFYGAEDCPPCMRFKRQSLPGVQEQAERLNFSVSVNVIPKTSDVPNAGSFGKSDALLREAGKKLSFIYPPIFIVTRGDTVVTAYLANWEQALDDAVTFSQAGK